MTIRFCHMIAAVNRRKLNCRTTLLCRTSWIGRSITIRDEFDAGNFMNFFIAEWVLCRAGLSRVGSRYSRGGCWKSLLKKCTQVFHLRPLIGSSDVIFLLLDLEDMVNTVFVGFIVECHYIWFCNNEIGKFSYCFLELLVSMFLNDVCLLLSWLQGFSGCSVFTAVNFVHTFCC